MSALIAYLRTIPPAGEMTPLPPAGFEEAVTARLPDDYWRTLKEGEKRAYHNSAEEVAYYKANQPPDLGPEMARGRMIASSGFGHEAAQFTAAERRDVIAYTRALARSRQTSSR